MMYNVISFCGIFIMCECAWLFSENKRIINVRVLAAGIMLQLFFGFVIFLFPFGISLFLWVNDAVVKVMESASAGSQFVFGRLALPPGIKNAAGEESLGFFLAFQGFPTIIFFSALMSILYYLNIMQKVITLFARIFSRLMKVSGAESLCAASNIFVGIESSLTVKPYLERMTRSELATVLTAGMATVASNVLAVYVFSLRHVFPTIAGHLVSASFLSAPAAIIMAKIIVPETETPETLRKRVDVHYDRERNIIESIINGANAGVRLIVGIVALLIAVLGIVALFDSALIGFGQRINIATGWQVDWSLSGLLGYVFYPLSLVMGVPPADAGVVARIVGERMIVTEVKAYQDLAQAMAGGMFSHTRSAVLCAYALCGFAHIASLAIFIGGISAVAPGTTTSLARVGFKALIAATLACLMTACVAGTFFTEGSLLFKG